MNLPVLVTVEKITFMAALVLYLISAGCYFVFAAARKEKAGRIAYWISFAGVIVHTVCILTRGINAGRLPMTNQYEFASAFAWGIAVCFLIFVKKFRFNALGVVVMPVVFLMIGYASMQSREINELMPALQSSWLGFHVSMAIVAYGAFGVAFGVSVIFLLKDKMKDGFAGKQIPDEKTLDLIIYRAVALGFLFLTLCIITGAIWAKKAWGSYWSWDPKETWSLITWLIYSVFLHLRINRGMTGKKAAVFAAVGFVCVIFTYIGVNTLLSGLHSYN